MAHRLQCGNEARLLAYVAASVVLLLPAADVAAWAPSVPSSGIIQYAVKQIPDKEPGRTMVQTTWFKRSRVRMETNTPRGRIIDIAGPDGAYTLLPGSRKATKDPASGPVTNPFGEIEFAKHHGRRIGSEKLGNYECEIWEQITDLNQPGMPRGRVTVRQWISPDVGMPVKVDQKMPGFRTIMRLRWVRVGAKIPDSLFQFP